MCPSVVLINEHFKVMFSDQVIDYSMEINETITIYFNLFSQICTVYFDHQRIMRVKSTRKHCEVTIMNVEDKQYNYKYHGDCDRDL